MNYVEDLQRNLSFLGGKYELISDFISGVDKISILTNGVRQLLSTLTDRVQLNTNVDELAEIPFRQIRLIRRALCRFSRSWVTL